MVRIEIRRGDDKHSFVGKITITLHQMDNLLDDLADAINGDAESVLLQDVQFIIDGENQFGTLEIEPQE